MSSNVNIEIYRLTINHEILQYYYYFAGTYFFGEEGNNVEKVKNNAQFDERKIIVLSENVSYNIRMGDFFCSSDE